MWCLLTWPRFFSWWSSVSRMAIRFFSSWSIKLLINFTLMPLFSSFHILFPLPHLLCASVVGNISQHNSHNTVQSNLCAYFIPLYTIMHVLLIPCQPAQWFYSESNWAPAQWFYNAPLGLSSSFSPPPPPFSAGPPENNDRFPRKEKVCAHFLIINTSACSLATSLSSPCSVSAWYFVFRQKILDPDHHDQVDDHHNHESNLADHQQIIFTKLMIIMIMKEILLITSKSSWPSWWSWK